MLKIIVSILVFCTCAVAQVKFEVKNASKLYDVQIEVEKCADQTCEGPVTFTLFKKNNTTPFQVFKLPDTSFTLSTKADPSANLAVPYDEQYAFHFSDYNFDGIADLVLRDGNNGPYGAATYQIYLFSRAANQFILSEPFTELSQDGRLGQIKVDRNRKRFRTMSKSGCCFHMTEEFIVVNNQPKKVLEIEEDAFSDEKRVKITTKQLVGGRWRTTVKYMRRG